MHGEAVECLAAVNHAVHYQVNGLRGGIASDDRLDSFGDSGPERSGVAKRKCLPALGSTAEKTLAVPHLLYSLSRLATLPGATGAHRHAT